MTRPPADLPAVRLELDRQALLLTAAQARLAARVAEHCDSHLLLWMSEPAMDDSDGWVDPTRKYEALKAERLRAATEGAA